MKLRFFTPLLILIFSVALNARHFNTINSIKHLIPHFKLIAKEHAATKQWVFAFDIDDTIATPQGQDGKPSCFGSDRWFIHMVKKNKSLGMNHNQALNHAIQHYLHVHNYIDMTTPEAETASIIATLQHEQNITVLALTARSAEIADRTHQQLCSIGINFGEYTPQQEILLLPKDYPDLISPLLYRDGKIHCGNNDKGLALCKILDYLNIKPYGIVIIDDKEHHVKNVLHKAHEYNYVGIGLQYTNLADMLNTFDGNKVDALHQDFLHKYPKKIIVRL